MKKDTQWEVLTKSQIPNLNPEKLLEILLQNRGLTTKKDQDAFLHPDLGSVTTESVGINKKNLTKALSRIHGAIEKKQEIIVFGDYDVDGIAGTAILWETLNAMGAKVIPYIPSRTEEGYGLSIVGINNILEKNPKIKLIITVDNGIVANDAVDFAATKGIEVILTDHHVPSDNLPKAYTIVHTTSLCGTSVAYMLSIALGSTNTDHLALVALATVADLVPLTNGNRILLTEGLKVLRTTKRPGILALCEDAQIRQGDIDVYAIGHILAPRLNAMGRIASAMDSLRLLCTKDRMRAKALAEKLGITNRERQEMTKSLSLHAIEEVKNGKAKLSDLLVVYDEIYDEGVIGLVAGRLVEQFYRPSIVLSVGKSISKASARSVSGFNIVEFIRSASHLLINAGGHPMAAGFTIYTEKIAELESHFAEKLKEYITEELFIRTIKIDCELPLQFVTQELYESIQALAPFGMGNSEPTFVGEAKIVSIRQVGKDKNHLSMQFAPLPSSKEKSSRDVRTINSIAFGMGDRMSEFKTGDSVGIVYIIDENEWNNRKSLQLKIRDIKLIV